MTDTNPTVRYRLYIGGATHKDVERLAGEWFPAATIIPAVGIWKGQRERSTVIEVLGIDETDAEAFCTHNRVCHAARVACARFRQECVLVTLEDGAGIESIFVTGRGVTCQSQVTR